MSNRTRRGFGLGVLVTASALITALLAGPGVAAGAQGVAQPAVPKIAWRACTPAKAPLQCARVRVPLDHDKPKGPTIGLALIKYPATNKKQRIGSLFINPGGPGGSGVDTVRGFGDVFSKALGGRYDVIGFDPRGIVRSTPLICLRSNAEARQAIAPWAFPVTAAQQKAQQGYDVKFAAFCKQRGGPILNHMSTADVARDLDLLRAAVGDTRVNYLGFSYGSQLGSVYANLFPARVGRFVIDGVLDPIAWTTGTPSTKALPVTTRLRSGDGAQATLDQFLARCDRAATDTDPKTVCAFGPQAKQRFAKVAAKVKVRPVPIGGGSIGYADLISITLGGLYQAEAWPTVAELLKAIEDAPAGQASAPVVAARARLADQLGVTADSVAAAFPQTLEGFTGVLCPDSVNPKTYSSWPSAASRARGYFGAAWTWASSPCQPWPGVGSDRYLGPWKAKTAGPVLVVGNLYDPATPYHGAQQVANLLPNSRLLTYAGWGHTAYLAGVSTCTDRAVTRYLLTGALPAKGAVCPIEVDPFKVTGPGARAASGSRGVVGLSPAISGAIGG